MSKIPALIAKVNALQGKVNQAEGYAQACRAAVTQLEGALGALSSVSIDVAGMRSQSARVDRAREKAVSAQQGVRATRSRVSDAAGELNRIASKWERKADAFRSDLNAAKAELAGAVG